MSDNLFATIEPLGIQASDFTADESVNTALADGSFTASVPNISLTTSKPGIFYVGKEYSLETNYGRFTGIASQDTDNNESGMVSTAQKSVVISSGIETFNKTFSIPPYKGNLKGYFDMLSKKCGYEGRKAVYSGTEQLLIQGYLGNVFENISTFLTSLGYEIINSNDIIILRPWRRYEIDYTKMTELPTIEYSRDPQYKYINCYWYNQRWDNEGLAYPIKETGKERENPGNIWLPPMRPEAATVISVDNIGAGEGAYVEQELEVNASLESVEQPRCALPPAVTYSDADGATVYWYQGQFVPLGVKKYTINDPSELTGNPNLKHANAGEIADCTSNNVFYKCNTGYWSEIQDAEVGDDVFWKITLTASGFDPFSQIRLTPLNVGAVFTRVAADSGVTATLINGRIEVTNMGVGKKVTIYMTTKLLENEKKTGIPSYRIEQVSRMGTFSQDGYWTYPPSPNDFFAGMSIAQEITNESGQKIEEDFAVWHQFAEWTGQNFSKKDDFENFKQNYKVPSPGFYCVSDKDGNPMMPENWLSHGGKLKVEVLGETNKIRVKVWGADLPLDAPIYSVKPTWLSETEDIVGFDLTGHMTETTMFYVCQGIDPDNPSKGLWVYDDSIEQWPYAPYKIAISDGKGEHDGLYVIGSGIFYEKEKVEYISSNYLEEEEISYVDMQIDRVNYALVPANNTNPYLTNPWVCCDTVEEMLASLHKGIGNVNALIVENETQVGIASAFWDETQSAPIWGVMAIVDIALGATFICNKDGVEVDWNGKWEPKKYALGVDNKDDITTEIDSRWIVSSEKAMQVCQDFDTVSNGNTFTFSGQISMISETDIINYRRGSYEAVYDYMLYHGFSGTSFDDASNWWKEFLGGNPTYNDMSEAVMKGTSHNIAWNVFGNVAGQYITIPNRGTFRIESASITPAGISISGVEDTRFGDTNKYLQRINPDFTFGDADSVFEEVEKREQMQEGYTFGYNDQEPMRFQ